jgi:inosose dehydratase
MPRVAIHPLPWYLTVDGWHPELAPPLPEIYKQVRDAGFVAVHAAVPDDMSVSEYEELLAEIGLAAAPGYFATAFSDDEATRGALDSGRRAASQHAALGLEHIFIADSSPATERRAVPGQGVAFDADRLDRTIANVGLLAETMRAEGITPCLHQHVGTWIETEEETIAVLDAIDPGTLALGPDTGHLAWAGCDPGSLIERYRDRVGAIHLKDMRSTVAAQSREQGRNYHETAAAHLWTEPGRGDIDLERVLAALDGFGGWYVIDVDIADQPTPKETAVVSARWLQEQQLS